MKLTKKILADLATANGRRRVFILHPEDLEGAIEAYKQERRALRRAGQKPVAADTLKLYYDPHCVPNKYRWDATGTVCIITSTGIRIGITTVQRRKYGRKWHYIFTVKPDYHALPAGYTKTGIKRV